MGLSQYALFIHFFYFILFYFRNFVAFLCIYIYICPPSRFLRSFCAELTVSMAWVCVCLAHIPIIIGLILFLPYHPIKS